jgi:hypothetical protein
MSIPTEPSVACRTCATIVPKSRTLLGEAGLICEPCHLAIEEEIAAHVAAVEAQDGTRPWTVRVTVSNDHDEGGIASAIARKPRGALADAPKPRPKVEIILKWVVGAFFAATFLGTALQILWTALGFPRMWPGP